MREAALTGELHLHRVPASSWTNFGGRVTGPSRRRLPAKDMKVGSGTGKINYNNGVLSSL